MLSIKNCSITHENNSIINDISLDIAPGEIHALMGPNGSGKSTLAYSLMGHPKYRIQKGHITYNTYDLIDMDPDKRAALGIFLAFQQPYELPGVTVFSFLKACYQARHTSQISVADFKEILYQVMDILEMDYAFATRHVNVGFSGGEKKRLELLSMLVLKPTLVILDEIDSGLDIDALKLIGTSIQELKKNVPDTSFLIITHYPRMLEYIVPDSIHILVHGKIVQSGAASLAHVIDTQGYDAYTPR